MKNLAGDKQADQTIVEELKAAAIPIQGVGPQESEVPFTVIGNLEPWQFERAWYYWVAKASEGQGLPKEVAKALNVIFSETVRVQGYAGGTDVKTWLSPQGTIDSYHIDTQEGLNAFAAVVKTVREKIAAASKVQR